MDLRRADLAFDLDQPCFGVERNRAAE